MAGDEFEAGSTGVLDVPVKTATPGRAFLVCVVGTEVGETREIGERLVLGRGEVDLRVIDEGVSRRHAEIVAGAGGVVVRDLGSRNGTFVNGERVAERALVEGDKIQIGSSTIFRFTLQDAIDESFQRQMVEAALRDGLTRVFNRRYLLERLASEMAYALRHKTLLSLVLLDVDHFKAVNDAHGHLAGDAVLAGLAQRLAAAIRKEDVLARYGGEEFAVACRGIDREQTAAFAERMRRTVEARPLDIPGGALPVTISLGLAVLVPSVMRTPAELIDAADKALYRAKQAGRNRVMVG